MSLCIRLSLCRFFFFPLSVPRRGTASKTPQKKQKTIDLLRNGSLQMSPLEEFLSDTFHVPLPN